MAKLENPRLQEEVIRKGWATFAPFAYGRYLNRGRGGVLVKVSQMKVADTENNQLQIDGPVVYVTAGDVLRGDIVLPDGINEEFETYDPEREVVFLFDEGMRVHTFKGKPGDQLSPKELHEAKQ